ncbi:hypothetical protein C2G38_2189680 [Gigaspora rosea]|uniref:Uncharacterized protein n=1 Tax=Gigaspora rosea TaxID=44941 RepID=A0A397V4J4_9GLOM|nr:hypothetical protein C2G38_2189680 [Gigaspora rosea]
MVSINTCGTDCTDAKWIEYCNMPQIRNNETPTRRLIQLPNSGLYAPEIGIAICFSCDQLVYTGQRKKNIGNYNHIGMERHWKFSCTSNKCCGVTYNEYLLKVKKKSISEYNYDNEYTLHRYELRMQNAIKKTKRAREIGKKIQACIIIQCKFIEYYYRPDGLCASELAQHYKLLWIIREEMRQDPKGHCFAIVNNK